MSHFRTVFSPLQRLDESPAEPEYVRQEPGVWGEEEMDAALEWLALGP